MTSQKDTSSSQDQEWREIKDLMKCNFHWTLYSMSYSWQVKWCHASLLSFQTWCSRTLEMELNKTLNITKTQSISLTFLILIKRLFLKENTTLILSTTWMNLLIRFERLEILITFLWRSQSKISELFLKINKLLNTSSILKKSSKKTAMHLTFNTRKMRANS